MTSVDVAYGVAGELAAAGLDVWDVIPAGGEVGFSLEVENLGQVVGGCVAHGEWFETESPLDHLEHGGVIVDAVRDRPPMRSRRDDQARHPETAQPGTEVGSRVGRGGRRHMVEEPAPFV